MRLMTIMNRTALSTALAAILCALPLTAAHAQSLAYTLSPVTLTTQSGSTVNFQGTLTNTGNSTLFLNGIDFGYDANSTNVLTDTGFDASVPFSLAAGDSYTGNIFGITVAAGTPAGLYNGTATIQGGTDSGATNPLGSQAFHVGVVPVVVPEAGTFVMGLVGLAGGAIALRRRRS